MWKISSFKYYLKDKYFNAPACNTPNDFMVEFILKYMLMLLQHPQIKEALYTEDANGNTPAHLTSFHNDKKVHWLYH